VRPANDRKDAGSPPNHPPPNPKKSPAPAPEAIGQGPPRPIGPAALKALREAIKSGKYPSDQAVMRGIVRMIRKP
jgi:hypothetical protein